MIILLWGRLVITLDKRKAGYFGLYKIISFVICDCLLHFVPLVVHGLDGEL
jgi:hypothetical protein